VDYDSTRAVDRSGRAVRSFAADLPARPAGGDPLVARAGHVLRADDFHRDDRTSVVGLTLQAGRPPMPRSIYVPPAAVLDAHQADRHDGATVVSIVAGPRDIARQVFVSWCNARRELHVVPPAPTRSAAARALYFAGESGAVLFVPGSSLQPVVEAAFAFAQRHPQVPVAVVGPPDAVHQALREPDGRWSAQQRSRVVGGLVAADPASLQALESGTLRADETPLYRSDHEHVLHLLIRHDDALGDLFRVNHKVKVGRFKRYEVDFWCETLRLAIEVDGLQHEQHGQRRRDADRDQALAAVGVRSFRIRAGMVMRDPTAVVGLVRQVVQHRTQELSP
jgi:very-short-patch-repair endonuclease